MIRKMIIGLAGAATIAVAGLGAASTAEAGGYYHKPFVKFHVYKPYVHYKPFVKFHVYKPYVYVKPFHYGWHKPHYGW